MLWKSENPSAVIIKASVFKNSLSFHRIFYLSKKWLNVWFRLDFSLVFSDREQCLVRQGRTLLKFVFSCNNSLLCVMENFVLVDLCSLLKLSVFHDMSQGFFKL